jgi:predicted protein tyrosine phosphatase
MELFVYSRSAFEAVRPHDVPHVVISITSSTADIARVRDNPFRRDILRLSFPDADAASALFAERDLFSREHASSIWTFIRRHKDIERVIVHCDAGISRSAAVAAALARVLNGSDAEFFGGRYRPNMRTYRMLLDMGMEGIVT